MLAIIFIESHDSKQCVGTHLALRNGTQYYAQKGTFGLRRGTFVSSGRGALGFEVFKGALLHSLPKVRSHGHRGSPGPTSLETNVPTVV